MHTTGQRTLNWFTAMIDRNEQMHIVYEIYALSKQGKPQTLKYGISCQECFVNHLGNPRPEYQVIAIQKRMIYRNKTVAYKILHRNIPGRVKAKKLEQSYVDKYFARHQSKPPLQIRPVPTSLKP